MKNGGTYTSKDCKTAYTCNNNMITSSTKSCSTNSSCLNNGLSTVSKCICNLGFTGDGYTCTPIQTNIVQTTPAPGSNNFLKYLPLYWVSFLMINFMNDRWQLSFLRLSRFYCF